MVLGVPPWALEKLLEVVEMLQGLTAPVALKHGGRRRDEPTCRRRGVGDCFWRGLGRDCQD